MDKISKSLGYLALASAVLVGCMSTTNPATAEYDGEKDSNDEKRSRHEK